MKRFLLAAIAVVAIGLPAHAQFDFRTTGARSARVWEITCTPTAAPAVSDANMGKLFVPCAGVAGYSAGNIYVSQNTGPWTLLSSFAGAGAVTSVFSRTGAITAQQADYDGFFLTPAEGDALFLTPAEGNAAYIAGLASAVDSELVLFSGATGKAVKRATGTGLPLITSGVLSLFTTSAGLSGALSDETGSGALVFGTSPTIVTPTIASFANATHNHTNAAGGGQITSAAISGTTGTGNVVLATSPTLVTPVLGAATGTSLGLGATPPAGHRLHITGDNATTFPLISITNSAIPRTWWLYNGIDGGTGDFGIVDSTAGVTRLRIDTNGNASFGAAITAGARLNVDGALRLSDIAAPTTTTGAWIWSQTSTGLAVQSSGTLRLRTNSTTAALTLDTSGNAAVNGTITERARSVAMGEWTSVAFNAANFTASGSQTWTLDSADQSSLAYTLVGKTMVLEFVLSNTTVGGTPDLELRIAIPGGFTAARSTINSVYVSDNGTVGSGIAQTSAGTAHVKIFKQAVTNWTASTNATRVWGQITFEIQ